MGVEWSQVVLSGDSLSSATAMVTSLSRHSVWKNTLLLPAYFAALSALFIVLKGILSFKPVRSLVARVCRRHKQPAEESDDAIGQDVPVHGGIIADIKFHIDAKGGPTIFAYRILRLVGCLALVGLTIATLVIDESGRQTSFLEVLKKKRKKKKHASSDAFTEAEWLQVALCLTYTYASFLALVSVAVRRRWSQTANVHVVYLLLFTWAIFMYRDIWPLATYDLQPADMLDLLLWPKLAVLTVTAIPIPVLMPRPYIPVDPKDPAPEPNPEQTAPLLSLVIYSFLDPIIIKAYRIPHLPASELPPLADYDRAKNLRNRSFKHLDQFVGAKKEHLFFGLMKVFRREYLGIVTMTIIRVVAQYASPIGIKQLLNYLETGGSDATVRPWVWVAWLFLGPVIGTIAMQWYIFLTTGTLVRCEGIITQLVFEHALRIRMKAQTAADSSASSIVTSTPETASIAESDTSTESTTLNDNGTDLGNASVTSDLGKGKGKDCKDASNAAACKSKSSTDNLVGRLNNLITTDLSNIVEGRDFPMLIIQSPLIIAIGIALLYTFLGWSAFVGLVVMILLFPIPGYVAKVIQTVQIERMKKTDERVQTVTETMNVVRMIKLFGWEPKMNNQIAEKRDEELKYIWKRQILDISNGTLNFLIPIVTMIATFVTYTLIMKKQLKASTVFSSMAVFDLLRDQLHLIFFMVPACIQAKVSLDRVTEYLNETELLDEFQQPEKGPSRQGLEEFSVGPADPTVIGICNASFVWSSVDGSLTPSRRKFRLTIDDRVIFKRNGINLIIGPTGSGKTSMLMALLGEMHFLPSGPTSWCNLPREKGVAYAAQESWVQNETIRDNILFGAPYNEERYNKVIYQCGLVRDLTLFDAGDQTEVGEKGLTLSGGQRARITLARAVYSSADILLLDDVLAALDVHTSRWIVEKCLQGDLIRGRTVLLVDLMHLADNFADDKTHNVAMVSPIASYVVCLGTDGHVASQGAVAEILASDKEMQTEIRESSEANKKAEEASVADGPKEAEKSDGKLVVSEEIAEGHVSWKAVKLYLSNLGGPLFWFCFLSSMFVVDLGNVIQTWYLGYWASQYETHDPSEVSVPYYLTVFTCILMFGVIMYFVGYIIYILGSIKASRTIHRRLIEAISGTTLRWLDSTPSGRIIARCTQDISQVDGPVSQNLGWVIELTITLIIRLAAIVYMTPVFILPGIIVGALGTLLGQIYIKSQLGVKREMSNAKSPLLSHFGAAVAGLVSIRAFGAQDKFKNESLSRIDRYVRSGRTFYNLNRWVCIRIDTLGAVFAAGLAGYLVYGHQIGSASNTGFSLNMAVAFSSLILWWVRILNQFEVSGNSLERIQGYIDIEQEPKPTDRGIPPAYWPSSGAVSVERLSARYSAGGPKVLQDLSFEIKSGERVGIVGRTGSGKSSLTLSLLRCILTEGVVYYDGLPTRDINLDILRRNITIIPQVPELLSGSLRHNLDPFDENDDATLYNALRSAGLFSLQNDDDEGRLTLDSQIAAGGSNLSVGQRQILALARAIVRGSKLLILDEATSAIDYATDTIIQNSLRSILGQDVTLITVAHRLQTIMDSDKIMVLDAGRLVEFDTPTNLLKKEGGFLKSLVDQSGDREALYTMASSKR